MSRGFLRADSDRLTSSSVTIPSSVLTIGAWFRRSSVSNNFQAIVSVGDSSEHYIIYAMQGTPKPVRLEARDSGGTTSVDSTGGYTTDAWHHVCAVIRGATDREIYIDAAGSGSSSTSRSPSWSSETVRVAWNHNNSGLYDGDIAESSIWSADLSLTEIQALAAGVSPLLVRPESLVFQAPLMGDEDRDLIQGSTLSPSASPTVETHPPIFMPSAPHVMHAVAGGGGGGLPMPVAMHHYRQMRA